MSYDIHITRKNDWADKEGPIIKPEEWKAVANSDPEIEITGVAEATSRDGSRVLRLEKELLSRWRKDNSSEYFYFVYEDKRGDIYVSHADRIVIEKMKEIAEKLNAKVQGDDGEIY